MDPGHEGTGWNQDQDRHQPQPQPQDRIPHQPAAGGGADTDADFIPDSNADGDGGPRDGAGDPCRPPDQTPDAGRIGRTVPSPLPLPVSAVGFGFGSGLGGSVCGSGSVFSFNLNFGSGFSAGPGAPSGLPPRRERRLRPRAQAGPRQEPRRRTPAPPLPQPSDVTAPAVSPGAPPMTLEAATAAAGSHGVTAIIAEKWWLDLDARGWTDSRGRPITRPWSSLRSYAIAWRAHEARDLAMAEAMLLRAPGGDRSGGISGRMDGMDGAGGASPFGGHADRRRFSGPSSASGQSRTGTRGRGFSRGAGPARSAPAYSEKLEIKYL